LRIRPIAGGRCLALSGGGVAGFLPCGCGGVFNSRRNPHSMRATSSSVSGSQKSAMRRRSVSIAKTYPPVGECIYCGDRHSTLTREHIVPYGLGGNMILPRASCHTCADITKRFEQKCLRMTMGPLRIRLGVKTRHPKQRPKTLDLELLHEDGRLETVHVPAAQYPASIVLPRLFENPGILIGAPPSNSHMVFGIGSRRMSFTKLAPSIKLMRSV
jgi:hypothetical protein